WQRDFLAEIGLGDMLVRGALPEAADPVGSDLGPLTAAAASALGLTTVCRVGSGIIDAHAGALGVLGKFAGEVDGIDKHLGAIAGRIMALREIEGLDLGGRTHVVPDFHGNRSPLGDPNALGIISGLTLDSDFDSLCRLYWRTAVAIALGVRHILEALKLKGYA